MKMQIMNEMRPCIREAWQNGFEFKKIYDNERNSGTILIKKIRNELFKNAVYAIICDLARLGCSKEEIKEALVESNKVSKRPLKPNEVKNKLFKFVEWYFRRVRKGMPKIGCGKLKEYGMCVGEHNCAFHNQKILRMHKEARTLPFDIDELRKYLTIVYPNKAIYLISVVVAIRTFQVDHMTGEIVLLGMRTIADLIRETSGHRFEPMDISRFMAILIDEKVIEKVIQGKSGTVRRLANGYRFLSWHKPEEDIIGDEVAQVTLQNEVCSVSSEIQVTEKYPIGKLKFPNNYSNETPKDA